MSVNFKFRQVLLVVMCALCCSVSSAQLRNMTAVDMVELSRPSAPSLSPDHKTLIYLRSETNWSDNVANSQLYVADLETGESHKLFEKHASKESHSAAHWSADGSQLITTLKRKGDKHRQVYRYTMAGSSLEQLTQHPVSVARARWSRDGKGVYFLSKEAKDPQLETHKDWFIKEHETRQRGEVWYLDLATRETRRVIGGDYFVRDFSTSMDGKHYLYSRTTHGLIDRPESELWLRNVNDGTERQITHNLFSERKARLSPDNKHVAYIGTVNEKGEQYYEDNLFVQSVEGEQRQLLFPDVAIEVDSFRWGADGLSIFLLGNTGLRSHIYRYSLDDKTLRPVTEGDYVVTQWNYRSQDDSHAFVVFDATQPGEVFSLTSASKTPEQLTHDQRLLKESFQLPKHEAVQWRGRGRVMLEGLLVYPVGYNRNDRTGGPFPLVTISHGGPRSSAQFGSWSVSRYVPVLAGQGYGVFLPNYRGSNGYGDKITRGLVGDYFRYSHHDVMDGIDHLIKQGLADPDQLVKMGWSAGGHMTNKLITHTNRFKAASSGAGVADWVSLYGESDVRYNRNPWFGGSPWQKHAPSKSFYKQSPLKDAWRITTPTLFWAGGNDVRVPPTQAILIYRGAKAAGAETELYIAPDQPHNFKTPAYRLFKINTELAWYAKHLGRSKYSLMYPSAFYDASAQDSKDVPSGQE